MHITSPQALQIQVTQDIFVLYLDVILKDKFAQTPTGGKRTIIALQKNDF